MNESFPPSDSIDPLLTNYFRAELPDRFVAPAWTLRPSANELAARAENKRINSPGRKTLALSLLILASICAVFFAQKPTRLMITADSVQNSYLPSATADGKPMMQPPGKSAMKN